jgi:hypothetical protein
MSNNYDFERWLDMRMDELKNAYMLKVKGTTQIWPYDDYCCHVDEYIKTKQDDIYNAIVRELNKHE